MRVWDENENFHELLRSDAYINSPLSSSEIAAVFQLVTYLRNVGKIFDRVFGDPSQQKPDR